MVIDPNFDIKYIYGIINSKTVKFYWNKNLSDGKTLFPKIKKSQITEIPIPKISESAQLPFIEKVNQILTLKQADSKADTSVLEAQIDKMVYALYELTAAEILIVEGK